MAPSLKPNPPPNSQRAPVLPTRLRRSDLRGGFAFIPNRFLHQGFFEGLDHLERSLYFLLVLASDSNGVCFWSNRTICAALRIGSDALIGTRDSLRHRDLVAYNGAAFQVLSLPPSPDWRRDLRPFGDRP